MRSAWVTGAIAFCLAGLSSFPSELEAQTAEELREQLRLPVPAVPEVERWSIPAMGANTPSGFGASWGDVYAGVGGTTRARFLEKSFTDADAAVAAGFGIGDPLAYVGLEITLVSYSTVRSGFGTRAGVSLHLHRVVFGDAGIAIGWENALKRGPPDSGDSLYGVVSKWFQLRRSDFAPFSAVMVSAGVGGGRFRSQDDVDNDVDGVGVFGSVGVRILAPLTFVADWTGQDLTVLGSLTPFRNVSLIVAAGFADITGYARDDRPRPVGSVSYGFNFLNR